MLTIRLDDLGFWVEEAGKDTIFVKLTEIELPIARYGFVPRKDLPPIAEIYGELTKVHASQAVIMKNLIALYLPFRLFRVREFARLALVIGFIGHRGAGKSVGAVMVACLDWLIRGEPVWSNLPIKVRVRYQDSEVTFESIPIDTLDLFSMETYSSGCVLIDEINMTAAESSRFMSSANLEFSYKLQQIRKKNLSMIWTCQGWAWVDPRTRWQTDYVVNCRDAFHSRQSSCPGDKSGWTVFELSGLGGSFNFEYEQSHKFLTDFKIWEGFVWNRPWWGAYSTEKLQGKENYITAYKANSKSVAAGRKLELAESTEAPYRDYVAALVASGRTTFYADAFWEENAITTVGQKVAMGKELSKFFTRRRDTKGRRFYQLKNKEKETVT